jgi:hypothetical protein
MRVRSGKALSLGSTFVVHSSRIGVLGVSVAGIEEALLLNLLEAIRFLADVRDRIDRDITTA